MNYQRACQDKTVLPGMTTNTETEQVILGPGLKTSTWISENVELLVTLNENHQVKRDSETMDI